MKIHTFLTGIANTHLIEISRGIIIVDAGTPGQAKRILNKVETLGYAPQEVRLIFLTHGHLDHAGSSMDLKRATGAPIALHRADARLVATPYLMTPPGRNALIESSMRLVRPLFRLIRMEAFAPDIWLEDGQSLQEFGLSASVVQTPGHTRGSVSIAFEDGAMIVGDAILNLFRVALPLVWEDTDATVKSAKKIIALKPRVSYTGHGRAFDARALAEFSARRFGNN